MNDLSVVIDSFDGYQDLWEPFFEIFNQNYAECCYPIYLITNEKIYCSKRVLTIQTGHEINWVYRTRQAMKKIKSKYVLFMLEDYLIGNTVKQKDMDNILEYITAHELNYYRFLNIPKSRAVFDENRTYLKAINSKQKYGISTICAIWKTEFLCSLLDKAEMRKVKSAWDFEVFLCNTFTALPEQYLNYACVDTRDILGIKNGVYRGLWFRSTLRYFKNQGIIIDIKNRKKMSIRDTLKYNVIKFFDRILTYKQKVYVKIFLRKIGFLFLSDKK